MSATPPPEPPEPTGAIPCPRCGRPVPEDQHWCLECGYAARTAVQPTPRWRIPIAVAAVVAALALAALAVAFVDLTEDPDGAARTVLGTAPTTTPPTATVPPTVTAPSTVTVPPATVTAPAATVPPPTTTTQTVPTTPTIPTTPTLPTTQP
ncbi:MAG TPA: hypothetical protein VGW10_05990 [Solirubrobacteraceae bacterium]|nr:hypothetical protein [Solirubrobacteraceae bacterium]